MAIFVLKRREMWVAMLVELPAMGILWDRTFDDCGITKDSARQRDRVIVACDGCGTEASRIYETVSRTIRKKGRYHCHKCACGDAFRAECAARAYALWENPAYVARNLASVRSDAYRNKKREAAIALWQDADYREFMTSPEMKAARKVNSSRAAKTMWRDQTYRAKLIQRIRERMLRRWRDEDYREHMAQTQSAATVALWDSGTFTGVFDEAFSRKMREVNREILSREEVKEKLSAASILNWTDQEYAAKVKLALASHWESEEARRHQAELARAAATPEVRARLSIASKAAWNDETYRDVITKRSSAMWESAEFRQKMAVVRANQPRVSSLQTTLYAYLDDLGVPYHREGTPTALGFYVFDCLVPRQGAMAKHLLIECQGDYWHSLPKAVRNDRAKFTYVERYFPDHEIMYVWEHEFSAKERVLDRLKLKLGLKIETRSFAFQDVRLAPPTAAQLGEFLVRYHYIGKERGGVVHGAWLGDELVAVVVYSPPVRQNLTAMHGAHVELSRLCIHPSCHKKNFASWLLSRTMPAGLAVVAYADQTVGHLGTVYKAAGFRLSHETPADYWYVDAQGYVMHKRSLYGRAVRMGMKEGEFAERFGYQQRWGGKKRCYVRSVKGINSTS